MTCGYCGFRNNEEEHRCRRCGRKPDDAPSAAFAPHRTDGALAAAPQSEKRAGVALAPPEETAPNLSRPVQGTLFAARASNVIPFESFTASKPDSRQRPHSDAALRTAANPPARRSAPRLSENQATLEFLPPAPAGPRSLGTTVEAVISCEAPVATCLHRAIAAALDWSLVLIGYGLFLLTFRLAGGSFVLNKTTGLVFAATLPLVAFTYGLFWTVACAETPGMHWTQLRLTTFDGLPLSWPQRWLRFAGSCLSFCTVIGLLWSLADEESLNWQDHISRTFPTPLASETRIFHRR